MLTPYLLIVGVILPVVLSKLLLLIAWRPWSRKFVPGHWGGPVAVGGAFVCGFGLLVGLPHLFPPDGAAARLFYVGIAFAVLGLLDAMVRLPTILRAALVFLATAISAGVVLKFNFNPKMWDALHAALYLAVIGIAGLVWWASFEMTAVGGGITAPMAMAATSGLAALSIALAVDQSLGQGMGTIALALTVAMRLVLWSRRASVERGTAVVIAGVGIVLLAAARYVSDLDMSICFIFALAPLVLWIGWIPGIRSLRPWIRGTIQIALLLVVLGAGVGMAVAQFQRDKSDQASDPYSQLGG